MLSTLVPTAAQIRLTRPHAQWMLEVALMTNGSGRSSPAPTSNIDHFVTKSTVTDMTFRLAEMATWKRLLARLVAVGNSVLT